MLPLLQGIQAGLILAILIGPIFFALIQTTIEQGTKSGLAVGLGIWVSDALFIMGMFLGVSFLLDLVQWGGFEQTFGTIGGFVLIGTGLGTALSKPPTLQSSQVNVFSQIKGFFRLFFKGFLINTINPFTFFFWMSTMSMLTLKKDGSDYHSLLFFTGVFCTIVLTDLFKVLMAKKIRAKMTSQNLLRIRVLSGIALCVFGLVLMGRVWLF